MADSSILDLLKRAQARLVSHLTLDKGALAVVIGLSGGVLLLLLGTRFLQWYWVALVALASLGAGLYRLRKDLPSLYELAQRIDRRLRTADAISTALYFSENPDSSRQSICDLQQRDAAAVARKVDLREAVPYRRSRYLRPAAALALAALGLFALRYAVTGSLSLEPSLLQLALDSFFGSKPLEARNLSKNLKGSAGDQTDPAQDQSKDEESSEQRIDAADAGEADSAVSDDNRKAETGDPADKQDDENAKDGGQDQADQQGKEGEQQDKENSAQGKQQDGKQNPNSRSGKENSSMMNKIRDALANMLNKMRPQSQEESAKNSQQSKQQDNQQSDQNQSASAQSEASATSDQGQSQSKDAADAKNGQRNSDRNASQDSKSGAGSQDGDKAVKQAALLEAMGKLSEILGKRQENLKGEVLVEVGSTKQQLKTPQQQKQATHAEAGSEIHRDEVPLMYQQFVQQYFEEIRKPAAAQQPNRDGAGERR